MTERLVWDYLNRERVPESVWTARRDAWIADFDARHQGPAAPIVISDHIGHGVGGLWHPAENRRTDSKSEFRKWTRAHGCTEVGDQPIETGPRPQVSREDRINEIKRAMGAL